MFEYAKLLGLTIVVAFGCNEDPNAKYMPAGFEHLVLGTPAGELVEDSELKEPTPQQSTANKVVERELDDDLFKSVTMLFSAGRLMGAQFVVKEQRLNGDTFFGMVSAINKKMGCEAHLYKPGDFLEAIQAPVPEKVHRADWGACLTPEASEAKPTSVVLGWSELPKARVIGLTIINKKAVDWVPRGTQIDM